jgi:hypothetical protein
MDELHRSARRALLLPRMGGMASYVSKYQLHKDEIHFTETVDWGSGFFAGATGLIASNFRVNLKTNALVDDHLATIWLPDERIG